MGQFWYGLPSILGSNNGDPHLLNGIGIQKIIVTHALGAEAMQLAPLSSPCKSCVLWFFLMFNGTYGNNHIKWLPHSWQVRTIMKNPYSWQWSPVEHMQVTPSS
jgi:hypothetical protein